MSDERDIGAVIDEMYAMISGPKGPRDWSRQKGVFHPDARQMRTGLDAQGKPWIKIMSPDDYAADTTPFFLANDFHEVEIAREIKVFGNMAQAWSSYEAGDRRGINSIQLFKNADGAWRIVSMIWDNERPGLALPSPEIVNVRLLGEGTDVWAPVAAEHVRGDVFRIVGRRGEGEAAEFETGSLVRCRRQDLSSGEAMVAYEGLS